MKDKSTDSFLPPKFLERLQEQFPEHYLEIRKTFVRRPPVVRVNLHLISADEFKKQLNELGFDLEEIPLLPYSFIVRNRTRKDLSELPHYEQGLFYMQSMASQLIVKALDPQPGEKILDLCAAPGSKTSQIAMLMNKQGELIANDQKTNRYKRMKGILADQHLGDFVDCKNHKGQNYPHYYPEYFDKILVDPSCSSEATFVDDKQNTIHFWSPHKVKNFARNQKKLISTALQCLKPGGLLVYSTCTLSPHENEWMVSKILKKHPEITVEDPHWDLRQLPIATSWQDKAFDERVAKCIRPFPTSDCEPFFICRFRKNHTEP